MAHRICKNRGAHAESICVVLALNVNEPQIVTQLDQCWWQTTAAAAVTSIKPSSGFQLNLSVWPWFDLHAPPMGLAVLRNGTNKSLTTGLVTGWTVVAWFKVLTDLLLGTACMMPATTTRRHGLRNAVCRSCWWENRDSVQCLPFRTRTKLSLPILIATSRLVNIERLYLKWKGLN